MPRRSQGARLYLRRNRIDRRTRKPLPDVWVIRDGALEISTGCDPDRLRGPGGAEEHLAAYLAGKFASPPPEPAERRRDPASVLVAEVIAAYTIERAPHLELDKATAKRMIANLTEWWGGRTLADVKRSTCKEYIKHRTGQPDGRYKDPDNAPRVSQQTAARELDILGGAIGWWHGEDTLTTRPMVWRPEAAESPRNALTRGEAARLLKASLGYRLEADGRWTRLDASARANRAHLRRFVLMGTYTGSRHDVMRRLLWEEGLTDPWADLEGGVIYRRGRNERESRTKRRPVVKLPRRLLAHMRRWRRLDAAKSKSLDAPIVTVLHHGGHPLAGPIRTGFEGIVRDAGLPEEVTPHWMRHTAATWLMEGGADMWDAAGYLGMTVATLEKHYGHHRPDHQAASVAAIGRAR